MLLKIEKKGGGLPLLAAPCRVFQHPLERALNRRARNALAANAHGSRAKLASLTWPRPSADECSLDDLSSSAFGHAPHALIILFKIFGLLTSSGPKDYRRPSHNGPKSHWSYTYIASHCLSKFYLDIPQTPPLQGLQPLLQDRTSKNFHPND